MDATDPNVTASASDDRWFLGSRMRVLATAADTRGAYGMMVQQMRRGFSPPAHQHRHEDDAYLVLDGEVTFVSNGVESRLGPGGWLFLRRGVPHTFRVDSDEATVVEIVSPGGFEQWHVDCSDPATGDGLPPEAVIDVERIRSTIGPYEVDIVGPPLS